MIPVAAWLIGAAAGAVYSYLKSEKEPEQKSYNGVGWSGEITSTLPIATVREALDDILRRDCGFHGIFSSSNGDDYFRGDNSIQCLPATRKVTWGETPVFLTVCYSPTPAGCNTELKFASPPAVTFTDIGVKFFHDHAQSEYHEILEALRAGPRDKHSSRTNGNGNAPGDSARAEHDADFALFGLSRGASWDQVQTAYRDACLKFHPDRLRGQNVPQHLVDLAVREFRARTEAYQRLKALLAN